MGYKTRRILKYHSTVRILKKEYTDLLSFTFGLQLEIKGTKKAVSQKTKQLLLQSVRDLNQKRKMLIKTFDMIVNERSAQWIKDSKR